MLFRSNEPQHSQQQIFSVDDNPEWTARFITLVKIVVLIKKFLVLDKYFQESNSWTQHNLFCIYMVDQAPKALLEAR